MRYYLLHSAAFDYPPFTYHTDMYKEAVKRSGGKNVRTARQFGWSNQPRVVTWAVDQVDEFDRATVRAIDSELEKCPPFAGNGGLPCPLIIPYTRGKAPAQLQNGG